MTEQLIWARDTGSEMQLRDVRTLIDESVDWPYLKVGCEVGRRREIGCGLQVNDTPPEMEKMVAERDKLMTPDRRMRIASSI